MNKLFIFILTLYTTCLAAPPSAEQQATQLATLLHQAEAAYYNQSTSLLSDSAYDALRDQYETLIARYPELTNSPTVGAPPEKTADSILHDAPVLSLQKAYSDPEVDAFINRCGFHLLYCIEPKIDGITLVLHYRNGRLTQALTRGDGKNGTDVTAAVIASGAIPITLTNAPEQLDIRGEAFLTFHDFETLNQRRIKAGEAPLKNPRNAASGTLNLTDLSEIATRALSIRIFDLLDTDSMPPTHTDALALLRNTGLPVIESQTVSSAHVIETTQQLTQQRLTLPYPTDGVVIKIDESAIFRELGNTAHHPRGAIARKLKETPIETKLLQIDWTRSDAGKITPIATFIPVEIDGATIQKATLHNLDHLRALDLKIGDTILVIRAGGSVPEIIGLSPRPRTGDEIPIPDPIL